ncbi:THAP domain-containing protein 3-like [Amphiura filiformis]|uniref:THAP domain-containing protein 3-like n=1 Tax=Amphiura filiformis TaxID=82378 RepID=UPI003B220D5B
MPKMCIAPLCKTHRIRKPEDRAKVGLSFHRLPLKTPILLSQWMQNLADHGDSQWKMRYLNFSQGKPKNMAVCSLHFTSDCFDTSFASPHLKTNAVPTLFGFNACAQRCFEHARSRASFNIQHDHTYPLGDATSIKLKLHEMQDRIQQVQKYKLFNQSKFTKLQSQLKDTKRMLVTAQRKVKQLEYLDSLLRTAQITDGTPKGQKRLHQVKLV